MAAAFQPSGKLFSGHDRAGAVSPALVWLGASLVLLAALVALLFQGGNHDHSTKDLVFYCAASMRKPVEEIIAHYRTEHGVNVQVRYGGSNTLLGELEISQMGDLYLPADDSYLQLAKARGLVSEVLSLARMQAVVGVPRGNPRHIASLDDLLQPDTRLVIANPDQAAIGNAVRDALRAADGWDKINAQARRRGVFKPTVNDAANDIKLGAVDAGFLWDAVAAQYPEIDTVSLPELASATGDIGVGVLTSSKDPTAALHFARYLAAHDRGLAVFEREGYQPIDAQQR